MVVLLMGVSGVGKTTIGQALAQRMGWQFTDADHFHPGANVTKMRAGFPLNDEDRAPWLESLTEAIAGWLAGGKSVVLACSALKESYRQQLMISSEVRLVFLHADFDVIAQRLQARHGHYMNPALLKSQFDTLEIPKQAISIDAGAPVDNAVEGIRAALGV